MHIFYNEKADLRIIVNLKDYNEAHERLKEFIDSKHNTESVKIEDFQVEQYDFLIG